ncbi:hypothetical protein HYW18_03770 [Candidatus Uhrbacteria bacterium]|nr:hypothetical protein [Candidatus Uhrbacteria bacterium]
MTEARKRSLQATAVFVGSTLGAGVFGLPYAFAQSGWVAGAFFLVVLGFFLLLLQLLLAEITIQTPGQSRLVGLAGHYLGPGARAIAMLIFFGGQWGILLSYLILGGEFLRTLFPALPPLAGPSMFFLVGLLLVVLPLRRAASFELLIGAVLLTLFLVLMLSGLPAFDPALITAVNLEHFFVPYGIILFATSSLGVMPEMHAILGERYEYRLPRAVLYGSGIIFLLYLLFTFLMVGVTGSTTTPNVLLGFARVIGPDMAAVGSVLGLLTLWSIFMMIGEQLKDTCRRDLGFGRLSAVVLALGVPALLFLFGVREFITVISFTGTVFSALLACLILVIYRRLQRTVCRRIKCFTIPLPLLWLIGLLFFAGAVVELLSHVV